MLTSLLLPISFVSIVALFTRDLRRRGVAPYFSPPEDNRDIRVEPMGAVAPRVVTAAEFQDLERGVHQHWLCVMKRTEDLRKAGKDTVNARCRRALRQMTLLAGPTWGSGEQLDHIVPWKLAEATNDTYQVPLWHVTVTRAGSEGRTRGVFAIRGGFPICGSEACLANGKMQSTPRFYGALKMKSTPTFCGGNK